MVREREQGRSGTIAVAVHGVVKIHYVVIFCFMRVSITKMDVVTHGSMVIMPSLIIPNMLGIKKDLFKTN